MHGVIALRRVFAALACAAAAPAVAAQHYIDLGGPDFFFRPAYLTITAGDSVTFVNHGGLHNVVADDGAFRCAHGCDADGGNGNASDDFWIATITLSEPGIVGYFCEPHGAPGSGMYGTIEVLAPPRPPTPAPAGGSTGWLLLALSMVAGAGAQTIGSRPSRRAR